MRNFCSATVLVFMATLFAVAQAQVDQQIDLRPPVATQSVAKPAVAPQNVNIFTPSCDVTQDWLKQQAEDLLKIVACYLDETSVDNEVAAEKKLGEEPARLIETRVKLLHAFAQKNVASHCQ